MTMNPQSGALKSTCLVSPVADFLLVGGLSFLFITPFIFFNIPSYSAVMLSLALAYIINDPHFIHSYQLMYGGFFQKLKAQKQNPNIYARYIFAGIVVPVIFAAWFLFCIVTQNIHALALSGNIMVLSVGWHYAKQGYGMLIVLSALKKIFYSSFEKNILLLNAYMVWLSTWALFNIRIGQIEIGDIPVPSIFIPPPLLHLLLSLLVLTTCLSILALGLHAIKTKKISINGIVGYFSAYIWLFLRSHNMALNALIPVFHSLQYLPFVWKYKMNESMDKTNSPEQAFSLRGLAFAPAFKPFRRFVVTGLFIGLCAFHIAPFVLDKIVPYNHAVFGTSLFFFMIIIFINVHHYFIDNVIWRKENKDVGLYLFEGFKTPRA